MGGAQARCTFSEDSTGTVVQSATYTCPDVFTQVHGSFKEETRGRRERLGGADVRDRSTRYSTRSFTSHINLVLAMPHLASSEDLLLIAEKNQKHASLLSGGVSSVNEDHVAIA